MYGRYSSTRFHNILYRGRLRLWRGSPAGVRVYGAACRGSLATTPRIGIRDLSGTGIRLHLSDAAPGAPAALLLGLSRPPLDLDLFGFLGCKLYTSVDLVLVTVTGRKGISKGYASLDLPLKLSATGTLTLHGQWLSLDTGKLKLGGLSDAILWRSQ